MPSANLALVSRSYEASFLSLKPSIATLAHQFAKALAQFKMAGALVRRYLKPLRSSVKTRNLRLPESRLRRRLAFPTLRCLTFCPASTKIPGVPRAHTLLGGQGGFQT